MCLLCLQLCLQEKADAEEEARLMAEAAAAEKARVEAEKAAAEAEAEAKR